jgi:AraC-like DNA-binding protein
MGQWVLVAEDSKVMRAPVFDSKDVSEVRTFLAGAYTGVRIGGEGPPQAVGRLRRDLLGQVSLDRVRLGCDLSYECVPPHTVCVVCVHSGGIDQREPGDGAQVLGPGQVGVLAAGDGPCSGVIRAGRYTLAAFDSGLLNSVAGEHAPVRIRDRRPRNPAAGRRLGAVLTHLRQMAASPVADDPLVAATAANYLAATVLDTLPTTTVAGGGCGAGGVTHPAPVRRAIAYLETHVREEVTLSEVAAASFVTPRALQLAFRRHLDTTPLGYLRQLRLAGAHEQLLAAVPGDGQTVTSVAGSWGFTHLGRFAAAYRRRYRRAPTTTLRNITTRASAE